MEMTKEEIKAAAKNYSEKVYYTTPRSINKDTIDDFTAGAEWAMKEMEKEKWISVEDRLPDEENKDYVVAGDKGVGQAWYGKRTTLDDAGFRFHSAGIITHWQPLPPPPKTDKP